MTELQGAKPPIHEPTTPEALSEARQDLMRFLSYFRERYPEAVAISSFGYVVGVIEKALFTDPGVKHFYELAKASGHSFRRSNHD